MARTYDLHTAPQRITGVMSTSRPEPSDEELVVRLHERDTSAFATLYDRHSRIAFGLAYRLLGEPAAAEDVVQEAFLALWRQAETFRAERSTVRTWLLSIVHHRAVDRLRRAASREVPETAVGGVPERADESVDIEAQVGAALEASQIRRALGALPPEQRQAIELAYFGGRSHSEIARMLDLPVGTVKGRMRLGLQKMKSLLAIAGLQSAVHDA